MAELEEELAVYSQNKERLLKEGHEGSFILIKGHQIIGIYKTAEEAYRTGIEKLGNVPMLIKEITPEDPTHFAPALMFGLLHAH